MNISKDPRSEQCLCSTQRVMQAQLLQSNLSLWEGELSAVLYHHLVIDEVLTSKIEGHDPSPLAGGATMESHNNSDNATSNQTAWQFVTLVS